MKRFSQGRARRPQRILLPLVALALSLPALPGCGGPPDSARAAQRHLVRGDYPAATAAANRSLEKHPRDPTSWRVKIRAAMAQGELEAAAQHYHDWKELRGSHDRTTYRLMAVSTLWQGLRVPAPEVKAQSIQIVERHEIEKLADSVRDAMGDDSDLVAAAAAVALLRSHPAAPRLASELLGSASPRVRAMLVRGIGKKAGRISIGDILPALGDSDVKVRRAAVSAIAGWKSKKDVGRLMSLAKNDSDGQVRSRALRGLLAKGNASVVPLANASLDDSYLGARLAALALLEKFSNASALDRARAMLVGADLTLAMRAAILLGKTDTPAAEAAIARAYASPDWSNRSAALNTATKVLSAPAALALAKRALDDVHEGVRIGGARLLIRLGHDELGVAALRRAMASVHFEQRLSAASELARRGDGDAVELLGKLARSGSPDQRRAALAAHSTASAVSDGLVAALGDENIGVRLAAADALLAR
ncbi:MAG: hypothetical protein GY811_00790 [Myxococcales bacterium]|nr:hypothetical protein [Myxococcales bacterium]